MRLNCIFLFVLLAILMVIAGTCNNSAYTDHFQKGYDYYGQGEYKKAIVEYDSAIAIETDADAYYARGSAYYSLSQHERAIEDYDTAGKLGRQL